MVPEDTHESIDARANGDGALVELSLVIPVFDEEENLRSFTRRSCATLAAWVSWEVVYVDDRGGPVLLKALRARTPTSGSFASGATSVRPPP